MASKSVALDDCRVVRGVLLVKYVSELGQDLISVFESYINHVYVEITPK